MDLLRQAVHDPVLNYYGISYGTGLGEVYANLFPGKVGHMLLDASLDPSRGAAPTGHCLCNCGTGMVRRTPRR
jgi:pimeloyl-ACP methyl ester carboxylesterase